MKISIDEFVALLYSVRSSTEHNNNPYTLRTNPTKTTTTPEANTTIKFVIPTRMGPALRGALEKLQNDLGTVSEGLHNAAREQAITNAIIAVTRVRVATTQKFPTPTKPADVRRDEAQYIDTESTK